MRAPKLKSKVITDGRIWKDRQKINNYPELDNVRVTRSLTRFMDYINNFTVIELYKCMPLLGGEENIPNWNVHIVHYSVVFMNTEEYFATIKDYRV